VLYLRGQAVHSLGLLEPEDGGKALTIFRNIRNQNLCTSLTGNLNFGQRGGENVKPRICALVRACE